MKKLFILCLMCAALCGLVAGQAQAAAKIPVLVASSVDTSDQTYMNVT